MKFLEKLIPLLLLWSLPIYANNISGSECFGLLANRSLASFNKIVQPPKSLRNFAESNEQAREVLKAFDDQDPALILAATSSDPAQIMTLLDAGVRTKVAVTTAKKYTFNFSPIEKRIDSALDLMITMSVCNLTPQADIGTIACALFAKHVVQFFSGYKENTNVNKQDKIEEVLARPIGWSDTWRQMLRTRISSPQILLWSGKLDRKQTSALQFPEHLSFLAVLDTDAAGQPSLSLFALDKDTLSSSSSSSVNPNAAEAERAGSRVIRPQRIRIGKTEPIQSNSSEQKQELPPPGIQVFVEDGLEDFFQQGKNLSDLSKLPTLAGRHGFSWQRYAPKVMSVLSRIHGARSLSDLKSQTGMDRFKYFSTGPFAGCYAVEIDLQWRVILHWSSLEPGPTVLGVFDYHNDKRMP